MEKVISNLKNQEIIYTKSVELLKNYIKNKYPEETEVFRAQVFADAIHKIVDDHIKEFRRADQKKIKASVLEAASQKATFEVNAYDIMKTCVSLDIDEDAFVDDLTSWINRQQEVPVYKDQLIEITEVVKEEIRREAEAESRGVEVDERLLDQLEAAFDYMPDTQDNTPELFSEGQINEAYEAEITKEKNVADQDELTQNGLVKDDALKIEDVTLNDLRDDMTMDYAGEEDEVFLMFDEEEQNPEDLALFGGDESEEVDESTLDVDDVYEPLMDYYDEDFNPEPEVVEATKVEESLDEISTSVIEAVEQVEEAVEEVVYSSEPAPFTNAISHQKLSIQEEKKREEASFNMFNVMDQVYNDEIVSEGLEAVDKVKDDLTEANESEERPIIKIEREPTPTVIDPNEKPISLEPVEKGPSVKEAMSAFFKSDRNKKYISHGIMYIIGFFILVWLLLQIMDAYMERPEEVEPMPEIEETSLINDGSDDQKDVAENIVIEDVPMAQGIAEIEGIELHSSIKYKAIDEGALQAWLVRNGSLVGESPFFHIIINVSREYGVNPLLMFAITGQEQGFVPNDHEYAGEMINNPFNVYRSWQEYNTTLQDSAMIAARTILTLSEDRPEDMDPVVWINEKYAEDKNWSTGVNIILEQLEAVASSSSK